MLWKCSLGPINSKLDNHAGNFPLKLQVPLLEIKKRFEKAFALEKFYINSSSARVTCGFVTPDKLFFQRRRKHTKS